MDKIAADLVKTVGKIVKFLCMMAVVTQHICKQGKSLFRGGCCSMAVRMCCSVCMSMDMCMPSVLMLMSVSMLIYMLCRVMICGAHKYLRIWIFYFNYYNIPCS